MNPAHLMAVQFVGNGSGHVSLEIGYMICCLDLFCRNCFVFGIGFTFQGMALISKGWI